MRASSATPSPAKWFAAALATLALSLALCASMGVASLDEATSEGRWIAGYEDLQPAKLERGARIESERLAPAKPPAPQAILPAARAIPAHDWAAGQANGPAAFRPSSPASRPPHPTGPPSLG
jgi:hypothetical protein